MIRSTAQSVTLYLTDKDTGTEVAVVAVAPGSWLDPLLRADSGRFLRMASIAEGLLSEFGRTRETIIGRINALSAYVGHEVTLIEAVQLARSLC